MQKITTVWEKGNEKGFGWVRLESALKLIRAPRGHPGCWQRIQSRVADCLEARMQVLGVKQWVCGAYREREKMQTGLLDRASKRVLTHA